MVQLKVFHNFLVQSSHLDQEECQRKIICTRLVTLDLAYPLHRHSNRIFKICFGNLELYSIEQSQINCWEVSIRTFTLDFLKFLIFGFPKLGNQAQKMSPNSTCFTYKPEWIPLSSSSLASQEVAFLTTCKTGPWKPASWQVFLRDFHRLCFNKKALSEVKEVNFVSLKVNSHSWLNENHSQIRYSRRGFGWIPYFSNYILVQRRTDYYWTYVNNYIAMSFKEI